MAGLKGFSDHCIYVKRILTGMGFKFSTGSLLGVMDACGVRSNRKYMYIFFFHFK